MTLYSAIKVVIITEKMIAKGVCNIVEQEGATGYTIMAAGGKGSHGIRNISDQAAVIDDFSDVRIEVIDANRDKAIAIMKKVAEAYFNEYAGITYLDEVEVLRLAKF
jgi:nitrogen regulatory protein PII